MPEIRYLPDARWRRPGWLRGRRRRFRSRDDETVDADYRANGADRSRSTLLDTELWGRWRSTTRAAPAGEIAPRLAHAYGWSAQEAERLHDAALVHEVGKIATSETTLLHSGPLTPAEDGRVKARTRVGATMLEDVIAPDQVSGCAATMNTVTGRATRMALRVMRRPWARVFSRLRMSGAP